MAAKLAGEDMVAGDPRYRDVLDKTCKTLEAATTSGNPFNFLQLVMVNEKAARGVHDRSPTVSAGNACVVFCHRRQIAGGARNNPRRAGCARRIRSGGPSAARVYRQGAHRHRQDGAALRGTGSASRHSVRSTVRAGPGLACMRAEPFTILGTKTI